MCESLCGNAGPAAHCSSELHPTHLPHVRECVGQRAATRAPRHCRANSATSLQECRLSARLPESTAGVTLRRCASSAAAAGSSAASRVTLWWSWFSYPPSAPLLVTDPAPRQSSAVPGPQAIELRRHRMRSARRAQPSRASSHLLLTRTVALCCAGVRRVAAQHALCQPVPPPPAVRAAAQCARAEG